MVGEPGPEGDGGHAPVRRKELGHGPRVRAVALIRTASVFQPAEHEPRVEGAGDRPERLLQNRRRSAIVGSFVPAKPPTTSEWPPRYFVVEWSTMSARGRAGSGGTASRRCCRRPAAPRPPSPRPRTPAMSTRFRSGFVASRSRRAVRPRRAPPARR
jgi:hypothetical protein